MLRIKKLPNKIKNCIYGAITKGETEFAEKYLAWTSLLWLMIMLEPFGVVDDLWSPYRYIWFIETHLFWIIMFLLFVGLTFAERVFKIDNKYYRFVTAFTGLFLWMLVTLSIIFSDIAFPAISAPLITGVVLAWWVTIRAGVDINVQHN